MNKLLLIPIIAGGVLFTLGTALFVVGVVNSTVNNKPVTKEVELTDNFNKIDIDVSVTDIEFKATTDGTQKVVFEEREKEHHSAVVSNETLNIRYQNDKKWFEKIFVFDWKPMKATIYMPVATYADLKIKTSTGDTTIPSDFTFENVDYQASTGDLKMSATVSSYLQVKTSTGNVTMTDANVKNMILNSSTGGYKLTNVNVEEKGDIKVSTGRISLTNVTAQDLDLKASTGNITLTDTVVTNHLEIKASTGNVKLSKSDAKTINVKTSTGDVTMTLLSKHIFVVDTDTGKKSYPKDSTEGGICQVETDTGDIKITIVTE